MIIFKAVNSDNRQDLLNLSIKKEQDGYIESIAQCLKEADELSLWEPVGIYNNNVLIGFAMYGLFQEEGKEGRVWLDRFLIDQHYQGKGLGKKSLIALINHIFKQYSYQEIYLSLYEDNQTALHLYQQLGFKFNNELDIHKELVMVLKKRQYHEKMSSLSK